MFSYTTGGPFGLEDMVTTSGPGMTLIYLLVLPFFWCIPVSLVSAELTTAMPVEGGFYRWTRAAFGDFWGFLSGWWNWSASFLLGGAYAVLFTDYLVYYFPEMTWWKHYLVSVALIAVIDVDQRARHPDGWKSRHRAGDFHLHSGDDDDRDRPDPVASQSVHALGASASGDIQNVRRRTGAGLVAVFRVRTTLDRGGRSREPATAYPRALALVVPLSIAAYFLPTLAGLASAGNWEKWHTGYFSDAAAMIGGHWPWLGTG